MRLSRYIKIFPSPDTPHHLILYSTRRCSVLCMPEDTLKRIEDGTLSKTDEDTLVHYGILVSDPNKEREEMLNRFDKANLKRKRSTAIVVLNLDCNLSCGYCFEEGVRGKYEMTFQTADLLIEKIEREHLAKGGEVFLEFYGGEPLLSGDLIRYISTRLKKSSEKYGLPFEFSLVTNGTLLTHLTALELEKFGLKRAMITLDGPREVHNPSRPFVSGKGSFDIIVNNILEIMDVIKVQICGNFTKENYREFPSLLDHLLDVGITPDKLEVVQFNQIMGRVGDVATPDFPSVCNCTDEEWVCEATVFLREEILRRGYPVPKPRPAGCMVESDNDLVINVDGSIYKCPVFVGREGFSVGSLQSGIDRDNAVYGPGIWKRDECLDCPWLPQCFGGCRFMKYLRDGRIDGPDCWKSFLEATLEKCVLQDLKYHPQKMRRSNDEIPV